MPENDQTDALFVLFTSICLLLIRHQDVVGVLIHDVASVDDLLTSLHDAAGQWDAVVEFVQARFTAGSVVCQVGRDIVVEITFPKYLLVSGQCLIEKNLFIGRYDGVDLGDGYAGDILAVDDSDSLGRVLMQDGVFRTVHDTLGIEVAQPIGYDAQIVVGEAGNTFIIILVELTYFLAYDLLITNIVGLVVLHQTVAFCLDGLVAFIDGEVEGGAQGIIYPGLASLDLETGLGVTRHQPDDNGGCCQNQC